MKYVTSCKEALYYIIIHKLYTTDAYKNLLLILVHLLTQTPISQTCNNEIVFFIHLYRYISEVPI